MERNGVLSGHQTKAILDHVDKVTRDLRLARARSKRFQWWGKQNVEMVNLEPKTINQPEMVNMEGLVLIEGSNKPVPTSWTQFSSLRRKRRRGGNHKLT